MSVATKLRIGHAQVFRMGHVVEVLQMSAAELDEHLLRTAQDNPFLIVRKRARAAIRLGNANDLIDTGFADRPSSLYDHVMRELAGLLAHGGPMERLVMALIEELDPCGWLGRPIPEIAALLGLAEKIVEDGLTLVQRRISPAGLFARDLKDCLRLQLEDRELWSEDAAAVLAHLEVLERAGVAGLALASGLTREAVVAQLARLRGLDPKPGSQFAHDLTLMRDPDVRIEPQGDGWRAQFKARFETQVAMQPTPSGETSAEMRQAIAEARALKQALDLRQNALKHIVNALLDLQGDYFHKGPEALVPLSQADLARRTGFHLSTVSRVLNGLLIEGPNGVVLARELCARRCAVGPENGPSKPKVLARLRALLLAESQMRPLSDLCLAECLATQGLKISRRVVSKYRQELGFAPAAQRRTCA
jgi:RNA polymerase sigma-54 factor